MKLPPFPWKVGEVIDPDDYSRYRYEYDQGIRILGPLERLKFANSYTRMRAVLDCSRRRDFWALLGNAWPGCDNIHESARRLRHCFERKYPASCWPIAAAMTRDEVEYFRNLPAVVTVWRGCYRENISGFSWSLDRPVAEAFPFLNRYWRPDGRPLLVEGRLRKAKIAFIKLDREEAEIVTLPKFVRQRCTWLLSNDRADALRQRKAEEIQ